MRSSYSPTIRNKQTNCLENVHSFLVLFFERVNIHGFTYFGHRYLQFMEKLFWLVLVIVSASATIILSLQSLYRYEYKSTVVSIERDHYYWNTTLPSVTICPIVNRIDVALFDKYCKDNAIEGQAKEEFYNFIESMANATYDSFDLIKEYDSIDKMNIKPEDYMMLIYNLTEDRLRNGDGELRVRAFRNLDFIGCEQVLTERGICYTSNNFLAANLSAQYILTGVKPKPLQSYDFYKNRQFYEVISGNLFDGDKSYSMVGFSNEVMYNAMNSYEFLCSPTEMVADQNFQRDTSVSQRNCRFNSESNLTHFPIYTRGLCLQECRLQLIYRLCGCIPHFYPNKIPKPKPVCSYKTLKQCVAPKQELLLELRSSDEGEAENIDCACLQNCVDSDVFINAYKVLLDTNELLGSIGGIVVVREYPLVRYRRKILFSLTDLYVSIGASASLFTGVCVLGIIEVIYFFTIRLFWHLLGKKVEPTENCIDIAKTE